VQLCTEALAAAVSIDVRGVEEGDTPLEGLLEHRVRGVRIDRPPIGAELPRSKADHADAAIQPFDHAPLLVAMMTDGWPLRAEPVAGLDLTSLMRLALLGARGMLSSRPREAL